MPFDIAAGIAAARHGSEILKTLREALTKPDIEHNEINNRIVEIQGLIIDSRDALINAQEMEQKLRSQIAAMDEFKAIEADMHYVADGHFFVRKSEESKGLLAYCPLCWGDSRKLILLTPMNPRTKLRCVLHSTVHFAEAYLEEQRKVASERG